MNCLVSGQQILAVSIICGETCAVSVAAKVSAPLFSLSLFAGSLRW